MGSKRKLIVGIFSVLAVSIVLIVAYSSVLKRDENYSTKLISAMSEQETVILQDVFSFEFERAYVFIDCYISGEGLTERYDLDISINEVEAGVSENIQRIVFVDELGNFVYEFKCDSNDLIILEKGIIIYPETVIERKSHNQEKPLIINFKSSDRYDYLNGL